MVPGAGIEPARLAAGDFESQYEMSAGAACRSIISSKSWGFLAALPLWRQTLRKRFFAMRHGCRHDFSAVWRVRPTVLWEAENDVAHAAYDFRSASLASFGAPIFRIVRVFSGRYNRAANVAFLRLSCPVQTKSSHRTAFSCSGLLR